MSISSKVWFDAWVLDAIQKRVIHVSSNGEIRSSTLGKVVGKNEPVETFEKANGAGLFYLKHEGVSELVPVARAVALYFVANPHGDVDVGYHNGQKADTRPCNLFWWTHDPKVKNDPKRNRLNGALLLAIRYSKEANDNLAQTHNQRESDIRRIKRYAFAGQVRA